MREAILYYALKYDGDYHKIAKAISLQAEWHPVIFHELYVTIVDDEYPNKLRRLQYAPWIIFYRGDLTLCDLPTCGVIGSRLTSGEGVTNCQRAVTLLQEKYVIVSGLAKGIDACSHHVAIHHKTIGVIGCGINIVYPKENEMIYQQMYKTQLVISEYPPNVKPYAFHFPWRNRILAALSDAILVVEAKKRSGTLLTVNEAISIGIPIYCIPQAYGNKDGEGCNLLISQGANIVVDEEDINEI